MKKIICLVGPSASGKTAICEYLLKNYSDVFAKVKTTTSRKPRPGESSDAYFFLSKNDFEKGISEGIFLEHSQYAGEYYGTPKYSVDIILGSGKIAIVPIDIKGAMAYKEFYGDSVITEFVYRDKQSTIESILERNIPTTEKTRRTLQLDKEYGNISLCDCCIVNNKTIEEAAKQVLKTLA